MLNINNNVYLSTIITSLDRIFKRASVDGNLRIDEIYLLNTVYNLLNTMCLNLTNSQRRNLMNFYNRVAFKSEYICTDLMLKAFEQPMSSKFTQAFVDPEDIVQNRYVNYWKSGLMSSVDDIVSDANAEFLKNQNEITISTFLNGYRFELVDVGRICIFINTISNKSISIYDELNNDVTNLFTVINNNQLNGTLIISNLVYNDLPVYLKLKINE